VGEKITPDLAAFVADLVEEEKAGRLNGPGAEEKGAAGLPFFLPMAAVDHRPHPPLRVAFDSFGKRTISNFGSLLNCQWEKRNIHARFRAKAATGLAEPTVLTRGPSPVRSR
jgi:hypothetical protein